MNRTTAKNVCACGQWKPTAAIGCWDCERRMRATTVTERERERLRNAVRR